MKGWRVHRFRRTQTLVFSYNGIVFLRIGLRPIFGQRLYWKGRQA